MNVRVDLSYPIKDGTEVVFKAPCDYSEVTGLVAYYPTDSGAIESMEFAFADAHANDLADLDALFASGAIVKVILDLSTSMAFVQNADTNAYLERRLAAITRDISTAKLSDDEKAKFSTLVGDEWLNSKLIEQSNNLNGFATWAYRNAGVDVSSYLDTVHKTFGKMFDATSKADGGNNDYKLLPETEDNRKQLAMLIPGSYGGADKMTNNGYKYTLSAASYQIGDIFCMRYNGILNDGTTSDSCYYMALYQADDTFLLYKDYGPEEEAINPPGTEVINYATLESIIEDTSAIYYYVLRPENVAIADAQYADHKVATLESKMKNLSNAYSNYTGALPISRGGTGASTAAKALANIGAMPTNMVHESITITPTSKSLDDYIDGYLSAMSSGTSKIVYVQNSKGDSEQYSLKQGGNKHMLLLTKITSNYARVLAWCTGTCLVRTKNEGEWGDWMWENPPMQYGVEYLTMEQYLGKPVYTKIVNCGTLPEPDGIPSNTWQKHISHGVSSANKIIRCAGTCNGRPLPFVNIDRESTMSINVSASHITVWWNPNVHTTNQKCEAQIWYTK